MNNVTPVFDHPVNRIGSDEAELHFVEYFDWNRMDYIKLEFFRTKIVAFDGQPDLVGRDALVETGYVHVFAAED